MKSLIRSFHKTLLVFCLLPQLSLAQPSSKKIIKLLKTYLGYLASDELEGRRTGTAGEQKAVDYIVARYKKLGINPYKEDYVQPFTFIYGKMPGSNNSLRIDQVLLTYSTDYITLPFSATSQTNSTAVIPDVVEQDNVWLVPLYGDEEEAADPHYQLEKNIWEKARDAEKTGCKALLVYENFTPKTPAIYDTLSLIENVTIPVLLLRNQAYQKYIGNDAYKEVSLQTEVVSVPRMGKNVLAEIDNKAKYTIVIGAHFDHLGYGEDGNTRYIGDHAIHNGADDNASGTAALLQIAAWLKKKNNPAYNYLFIHFSAEELGLFGSKAAVNTFHLDSNHIAAMFNMDMVGRLQDSTQKLTLGGIGTSQSWNQVVDLGKKTFKLALDSSGMGPSDHSSFYQAGVPVMFVFTGLHQDYHKPDDDAGKINYSGMASIMKFVYQSVGLLAKSAKPVFQTTKQSSLQASGTRFKVTLGIMPDYTYDGKGVRIDGILDGRPAHVAGLQRGDIITQLGEKIISGMQSYMEALGSFKKGDKILVKAIRGTELITLPLLF